MFENYLSRPNVRQPILTQYCDGQRVTCPDWMSQWGSKYLGDQGYSAIDILRSYYGNDMYINSAEGISGFRHPGRDMIWAWEQADKGTSAAGTAGKNFACLSGDTDDYGGRRFTDQGRGKRWKSFSRFSGLPVTGIVDYPTWYKISDIYVAVSPYRRTCIKRKNTDEKIIKLPCHMMAPDIRMAGIKKHRCNHTGKAADGAFGACRASGGSDRFRKNRCRSSCNRAGG